jgi:hypothetical protein
MARLKQAGGTLGEVRLRGARGLGRGKPEVERVRWVGQVTGIELKKRRECGVEEVRCISR